VNLQSFDHDQRSPRFGPAMQQVVAAALRVPAAAAELKEADRIVDAHGRLNTQGWVDDRRAGG
jgi:hypothetical protein